MRVCMKPQATIEKSPDSEHYLIQVEENGETTQVEQTFDDYQAALDYMLAQGWQLKRNAPAGSLHVDIRFRKP